MKIVLDKLLESGLSKSDFKKLGFEFRLNASDIRPHFKSMNALVIPYYDIDRKITDLYRIRYLGDYNGFGKPKRYAQPYGMLPQFYFPLSFDFKKVARNVNIPVYMTEGELKACCGCKNKLPVIGLGGVWNWMSRKHNLKHIKDFDLFEWEGRRVYLIYDSDLLTNKDVSLALTRLSKLLFDKGAHPHHIFLPSLPGLKSTGLDDFIVNKSLPEFNELVAKAKPFEGLEQAHQMNLEFTYIKEIDKVVEHSTGYLYSMNALCTSRCSNRTFIFGGEVGADGKALKKGKEVSVPDFWRKWPFRNEAGKLVYLPGGEIYTDDGGFNTWRGWGVEPKEGCVAPWNGLLTAIFGKEKSSRKWFEDWVAYQFQYPGTKMFSAVLFWSVRQGVGKSIVGETLGKIFGPDNYMEIDETSLHSDFSDFHSKQFVMGSEITGANQTRKMVDRMKSLITAPTYRVNIKNVQAYWVANTMNFFFTSNRPNALYIDDKDRRYFIHEIRRHKLTPDWFKNVYAEWMYGDGPAHLFYHYSHKYKINEAFNPQGPPPMTSDKELMIEANKSRLDQWIDTLYFDPDSILIGANSGRDLFSTEELVDICSAKDALRDVSPGKMSASLRNRFTILRDGKPIRPPSKSGLKTNRYWIIRNQEKWDEYDSDSVREHFLSWKRAVKLKQPVKKLIKGNFGG